MRVQIRHRWLVLVLVLVAALWLLLNRSSSSPSDTDPLRLNSLLGRADPAQGFGQAKRGESLVFPRDHAAHPNFRNEWWYLTGQLHNAANPAERFGYQFTLFRFALASPAPGPVANPWLRPQLYMAHAAVTHIGANQHRSEERFSRVGPGLAGAGGEPLRFWLQDWQMRSLQPGRLFPAQLSIALAEQGVALRLTLDSGRGRVLQGDGGFSLKNAQGGASYYYSYPRLAARGELEWDGQPIPVRGQAWYDHEWSSNSLAPDQAGWDWFALQLDDGSELMFYRFRDTTGATGHHQLARISAAGITDLTPERFSLEVLDHWQSPAGRRYPSGWRLRIPGHAIDLTIVPQVADQEMRHSVSYWEGAVRVAGSHSGSGYVELTGY